MTDWLRLTLPNPQDQTRSRWPIHPLWGYRSAMDWETDGSPLLPRHSDARLPNKDRLFGMALNALLAYMASEGMTDLYRGRKAFIRALYQYHDTRADKVGLLIDTYIAQKLALKGREFNTVFNDPEVETRRQAEAYRKARDGE